MQSHDFPPSAFFSPFLFLYHFYQLSNNHATPNLLHFLPEYVTLKSFHLELWAGQRPGVAPEALPEALASACRPAARDGPRGVTGSPCEGTQATRQGWPYYTRRLGQRPDRLVYSRATPGHPPGVASRRRLGKRPDRLVYSRATPCGWPEENGSGAIPLRVA